MNNIFSKIIEFILNVFAYKDKKETDLEEKPNIDTNIPKEEEKAPEVVEIKPNEVIDKPKEAIFVQKLLNIFDICKRLCDFFCFVIEIANFMS